MSWNRVKKQTQRQDIIAWCEEMEIENYTINSKGEIDVDGDVRLKGMNIKELPYKFGTVDGCFNIDKNTKLKSLNNCPYKTGGYFSCEGCTSLTSLVGAPKKVGGAFYCEGCTSLTSLEGAPKEVGGSFYCSDCKGKFTKEDVKKICNVKENIKL